jgi:hypothetical protein
MLVAETRMEREQSSGSLVVRNRPFFARACAASKLTARKWAHQVASELLAISYSSTVRTISSSNLRLVCARFTTPDSVGYLKRRLVMFGSSIFSFRLTLISKKDNAANPCECRR